MASLALEKETGRASQGDVLYAENMVRYALHLAVHIRRQFVTHVLHNLMEREGCRGTGPRVLGKKGEHWQRMEILSLLSLDRLFEVCLLSDSSQIRAFILDILAGCSSNLRMGCLIATLTSRTLDMLI